MSFVFQMYETTLIVTSLSVVLLLCILLFLPASSVLQTVGDYMIMFTHLFIIPTIHLATRTSWLAYLVGLTCVLSLLYHFIFIEYNGQVASENLRISFQRVDMSAQSVLVWLSTILFIFDDMPNVGLPFLTLVAIITSVFGDDTILFTDLDTLINGAAILCTLIFIIYKLIQSNCSLNANFFQEKRVWQFIFTGLGYFVLAFAFYIFATRISKHYEGEKEIISYNCLHASWHICAYMALYFIFKSRVARCYTLLNTVRIKRTQFAMHQEF